MNPDGAVNAATRPAGWNAPLLLLLAGGILFFWRLGSHDLWPPDEPRFALVAREMLDRGDPVVLSMNHGLYTDKPPLFFWAIDFTPASSSSKTLPSAAGFSPTRTCALSSANSPRASI